MKEIDGESSELEALIILKMMKREYLEKDLKENQAYYNQLMMYFKQIQKGEYYFPKREFKEQNREENENENEDDEIVDIANLLNKQQKGNRDMSGLKDELKEHYEQLINQKDMEYKQQQTQLIDNMNYLIEQNRREKQEKKEKQRQKELERQ